MADKLFADQLDDEEVLFVFRKHPLVMRKGLIIGMLCILGGTLPALIKPDFSVYFGGLGVGFVIGALLFSPYWISWFYSVFIVTNQRLIQITQKGLFKRSVVDLALNQIQMVNYEIFGIQQTLLGFGTIIIQTYMGDLIIHDVHHPARTQRRLLSILRDQGVVPLAAPFEQENQEEINEEAEA